MLWTLLEDVAARERLIINVLVSQIENEAKRVTNGEHNLTGMVRLFLLQYFRNAATEDGHRKAGHGQGAPLKGIDITRRHEDEDHEESPRRGATDRGFVAI